jgi:hypothetical protein
MVFECADEIVLTVKTIAPRVRIGQVAKKTMTDSSQLCDYLLATTLKYQGARRKK